MTFIEFLKIKKGLSVEGRAAAEFMADYYDEYAAYLAKQKDGCGSDASFEGEGERAGGGGNNSEGAGGGGDSPGGGGNTPGTGGPVDKD